MTAFTAAGVIAALAGATSRGVPYGNPDGDQWLIVHAPDANTARVSIVTPPTGDGEMPEVHATFNLAVTPATPPRPTAPDGANHRRCPSTVSSTAIPHPGHLWGPYGEQDRWCDGDIGLGVRLRPGT